MTVVLHLKNWGHQIAAANFYIMLHYLLIFDIFISPEKKKKTYIGERTVSRGCEEEGAILLDCFLHWLRLSPPQQMYSLMCICRIANRNTLFLRWHVTWPNFPVMSWVFSSLRTEPRGDHLDYWIMRLLSVINTELKLQCDILLKKKNNLYSESIKGEMASCISNIYCVTEIHNSWEGISEEINRLFSECPNT